MKHSVDLVMAARPNFMKVAPLYHALSRENAWCNLRIVHTGQHYDANMSHAFLRDLKLPEPHVHLGVGSGTHAEQTAGVMLAYERACLAHRPDWVVVVGDVNSTVACALAASKLDIGVAHLEAGLRSGDRTMPEEKNRVLTDALADLLWTPSPDADANLAREGIPASRIARVGNIMIDSLEMVRSSIEGAAKPAALGLQPGQYAVVTLHRPSNVDEPNMLSRLTGVLRRLASRLPIVFPVHPRTRARLEGNGMWNELSAAPGLKIVEPESYIGFMSLVFGAAYVLTDSGGVQEETTYLGIPCLTMRSTTERPITVTEGSNRLVTVESVEDSVNEALSGRWQRGRVPDLWDGRAAKRIVNSLRETIGV